MELKSIAKVNLGLHVKGRRADGYHLIETLFYPVHDLWDDVRLERIPGDACEVSMLGFEEEVPYEKNLCWRAWRLLEEAFPGQVGGFRVEVEKRIPAGAGLGGGSSNAGAVLRGIREMCGLDINDADLAEKAVGLGADVPFFIFQQPLYATGIGADFEELRLDLEGFRLEVEPQPWHSPTPAAYKELVFEEIPDGPALRELLALPVNEWEGRVRNDLEQSVFKRLPKVEEAKAGMYERGAVYASMTGSGSAVFGLFRDH